MRKLYAPLCIFIPIIIIEVFLGAYFSFTAGSFISASKLNEKLLDKNQFQDKEFGCRIENKFIPHPYLGYIQRPDGHCWDEKNSGFEGRKYPHKKDQRFYNLLVLGSSVSIGLIFHKADDEQRLEEYLNSKIQSPNKKPWRIINGSLSDYRQPQQLNAITNSIHLIDGVISIEGHNEHNVLQSDETFNQSFSDIFKVIHPPFSKGSISGSQKSKFLKTFLFTDNFIGAHSYIRYGLLNYWKKKTFSQMGLLSSLYEKNINVLSKSSIANKDKKIKHDIEIYKKTIRSIAGMTKANSINHAIFIQPVPWLHKPLTNEENYQLGSIDKKFYSRIYSLMEKELLSLKEENINIVSSTKILKDDYRRIYRDSVHFDENVKNGGNEILTNFIIRHLSILWKLKLISP